MMIDSPRSRPEQAHRWSILAWPVVFALLLRVAMLLLALHATGTTAIAAGDTASYLQPATELLHRGCFCINGQPQIDRTPGYPVFALLLGAASGHLLPLLLAQIALSVIALALVAALVGALTRSHRSARATAWLLACEPLSATHSIRVLSETLFDFFFVLLLFVLIRWLNQRRLRSAVLAGALLAVLAYVRPVAYSFALPIAFALPLLAPDANILPRSRRWFHAAAFLAVFAALVLPWQLRNHRAANTFAFSSVADKNLYFYVAGDVLAHQSRLPLEAWQRSVGKDDPALWLRLHPDQEHFTPSQRARWLRDQALRVLAAHRWLFLRSWFLGEIRLLASPGTTQLFRLFALSPRPATAAQWLIVVACMLYLLLLYVLMAIAIRRRVLVPRVLTLLLLLAAFFFAVSGGGQAVSRLRMPVMPILCLIAGSAFANSSERNGSQSKAR